VHPLARINVNAGPVQDRLSVRCRGSRTRDNRTGGQRRRAEYAGRRIPARAPAAFIPKPVIRWIGAFSFSKSPKSPQVRVMRTKQALAMRRAAFFGYPIFASFLVTLVQNSRGMVIIQKMTGQVICSVVDSKNLVVIREIRGCYAPGSRQQKSRYGQPARSAAH